MGSALPGVENSMVALTSMSSTTCSKAASPVAAATTVRRLAWSPSNDWADLKDEPTPMICKGTDGDVAIQNIYQVSGKGEGGGQKVDDAELVIKSLDPRTGIYTDLFSVTGLKNGCDISPVSSWAYCIARNKLARFGRDKVRWIAELPNEAFSATCGSIQEYVYIQYKGSVWGYPDVDSLPGYEDEDDPRLANYKKKTQ